MNRNHPLYNTIAWVSDEEEDRRAAERFELDRARQAEEERAQEAIHRREQIAREERRQRFAAQRQAQAQHEVPFLETSVFDLVNAMVERVVAVGRCGLLTGAPGVGKSRALREIVARGQDGRGRDAALIVMSGISGNSAKAVLDEVCACVEVEPAGSIAETERRLCKQVDYSPVLLFDEAQNLTLTPLRVLLGLSETIGIPMLFCGNAEVLKRVSSKQAAIQQIARRLPIREDVTCIMDEDVDLIAAQFGVCDVEALQLCRTIGAMFHADGVANVLTQATLDIPAGTPIGATHIRAALTWLPQFRAALAKSPAIPTSRTSVAPLLGRRG